MWLTQQKANLVPAAHVPYTLCLGSPKKYVLHADLSCFAPPGSEDRRQELLLSAWP